MGDRIQYGDTTLWLPNAHDCDNKEPIAHGRSGAKPLPGSSQLMANDPRGGPHFNQISYSLDKREGTNQ